MTANIPTLTIKNAKEYYRTYNEFTTKANDELLTSEKEIEYIKKTYARIEYDENITETDILCYIASDYDTMVINIKKIVKKS